MDEGVITIQNSRVTLTCAQHWPVLTSHHFIADSRTQLHFQLSQAGKYMHVTLYMVVDPVLILVYLHQKRHVLLYDDIVSWRKYGNGFFHPFRIYLPQRLLLIDISHIQGRTFLRDITPRLLYFDAESLPFLLLSFHLAYTNAYQYQPCHRTKLQNYSGWAAANYFFAWFWV